MKENEPWDIRGNDGMNETERKVFSAMKRIGLNPIPQYKISRMHADFAFPEKMTAVEIYGPPHKLPEQKEKDRHRKIVMQHLGWKVIEIESYNGEAYDNPDGVAKQVEEQVTGDMRKNPKIEKPIIETRNPRKKKVSIRTIAIITALILIFALMSRYNYSNANAPLEASSNPQLDAFCNEKCNTSTFGNIIVERISVIRCMCKDERGYPSIAYYFDSISKERISQTEFSRRVEQFQKSVTILP